MECCAAVGFDPESPAGPAASRALHLNSVHCSDDGLYFSGLRTGGLLRIAGTRLSLAAALPAGSHNAQPFGCGVIYNDTEGNRLWREICRAQCLPPVTADPARNCNGNWPRTPGWRAAVSPRPVRALLAAGGGRLLALRRSAFMISRTSSWSAQVELSRDVRNAHPWLAIWPYPA